MILPPRGASIGSVQAARVVGGTRDRAIVRSRARSINDPLRLDGRFLRADPSSASFSLCLRCFVRGACARAWCVFC